jgi:hypothetical protein
MKKHIEGWISVEFAARNKKSKVLRYAGLDPASEKKLLFECTWITLKSFISCSTFVHEHQVKLLYNGFNVRKQPLA